MDEVQAPEARAGWGRSAIVGAALSLVVGVVVLAFTWPSVSLDPTGIPVAIAGPEAAVQQVEAALGEQSGDRFDLIQVSDREAAADAIRTREVYGAIVLGEQPEVLTASAASTATHQMMTGLHTTLSAMAQQQAAAQAQAAGLTEVPQVEVPLTDVVPLSAADPQGAGLTAAALPLVFGGMIGGIAISFAVAGKRRRIVALVTYAVAGGLVITGIMAGWYGVLNGGFLATAGAFSLTLLAMGATIVGFEALLGRPGLAIGPVLFMLIANPISGAAYPKQFLPTPWGDVGQFLPPGAGASLIRSVSYFPEASVAFPVLVLCGWAALGLVLVGAGHLKHGSTPAHGSGAVAAADSVG